MPNIYLNKSVGKASETGPAAVYSLILLPITISLVPGKSVQLLLSKELGELDKSEVGGKLLQVSDAPPMVAPAPTQIDSGVPVVTEVVVTLPAVLTIVVVAV